MEDAENGQPCARITPDAGKLSREEQLSYVSDDPVYCIRIQQWSGDGLFERCRFLLLTPVSNRPDTFVRSGVGEVPIYSAQWAFEVENYKLRSWDKLWHKLRRRTITLL